MHFHGEAGSGKGSSKSSGDERTTRNHRHKKPNRNVADNASGSGAKPAADKPKADKPKADKPQSEPAKPAGTGGGSTGGQIATKPAPRPPVNVGVDPSKVPVGGAGSDDKPSKPSAGGSVAGTIATGSGGAANKPAKTPVNVGIDPSKVPVGGAGSDDKPAKPPLGGGVAGTIATGGTKPDAKPTPPIQSGAGGAIATGQTPGQSAASRAAAKLAAEAAAARGANGLPRGRTPNGEEKPADAPINKEDDKTATPSGAYAMIPATGQSGRGNLRVPVPITGISCKLSQNDLAMGSKFKVHGKGFEPAAKISVNGINVPVTRSKPTQLSVQLPSELANGGDVVLSQGDVIAPCGKLTIKPAK